MLGLTMLPPVSLPIEKPTKTAAVAEWLGAIVCRNSGSVEEILAAPGNAVKRPAVLAGGDFFVGPLRLREGEIARESDDAAQLRIELLDAAQVDLREALGGEFALLDPARELCYGGEGDVRIVGRYRAGVDLAANKLIALGTGWLARENGMVAREVCERRFESDGAGTRAALVKGGQVHAPGFCGEGAIRGC